MRLFKPRTISEAIHMLEDLGSGTRMLAGGTDIMPMVHRRQIKPKALVSIRDIKRLDFIKERSNGLLIGPLTTHASVANSRLVREKAESLAISSSLVGSPVTRNLGTIGGNLCWASPAADTAPPLLSLGAEIMWREGDEEHKSPLDSFFKGVNRTSLPPRALVTGIFVPPPISGMKTMFLKLGLRNAVTISVVSVAVAMALDVDRVVRSVRIVLGSVAPIPLVANAASRYLTGKEVNPETLTTAANLAADETTPISDVRASAWYRKEMARVYTIRALSAAAGLMEA